LLASIVSCSVKLRRKHCAPPLTGVPHNAFLTAVLNDPLPCKHSHQLTAGLGANRTAFGRLTDIKTPFGLLD
jgi:hypothetical protein